MPPITKNRRTESKQSTHDHSQENTATGVVAGIAVIACCVLSLLLWAETQPPPRVALVSQDTVEVEGFGYYSIESLGEASGFTPDERLYVMERTASHLRAYRMGFQDARGLQPSDTDLLWLSRIVYTESRGQGYRAMMYVANVAHNRMESNRYPNTMQEVALDPIQFSPFNDRSSAAQWRRLSLDTNEQYWEESMRIAYAMLSLPPDLRPLPDSTYHFYSPGAMDPLGRVPPWAEGQTPVVDMGDLFKFYAGVS